MIGFALLLVLLAYVTGGSDPLGLVGPTADRYLAGAAAHWEAHQVVHEAGTFMLDGHRYVVDLTEMRGGDGEGTLTVDGTRLQYRDTGGRTFLEADAGYWQPLVDARLAQFLTGRWVTTPSASQLVSTSSLDRSLVLLERARPGQWSPSKGATTRIGGVPAVELRDATTEVYVSTVAPERFLREVSEPGYRSPDGASDIRLDLDYPARLSVSAPHGVVDTEDPRTLPARYSVEPGSFRFDSCTGPSGCSMHATVRNLRGPQVGDASAEFDLGRPDGSSLGSCTATIPPIGNDQTEDVACRVTSQAWTAFTRVGGQYQGRVVLHNPFYD